MGFAEEYRKAAIQEVTCPTGVMARYRRPNALSLTVFMGGFPSLFDSKENGNGTGTEKDKENRLDYLTGGAKYQRGLIEKYVVELSLDGTDWVPLSAVPFDDLDGEDAQFLMETIQNRTDLKGKKADEARSFRGEPGSVPVG